MLTLRGLKQESQTVESIKLIADVLGDMATSRLKTTRSSIEQNIRFFHEITEVYRIVKELAIRNNLYKTYQSGKNGKTVCILLTSNDKFHGSLDNDLVRFFTSKTANLSSVDYIIIGGMGPQLLKALSYSNRYFPLRFAKDYPILGELQALAAQVFHYSRILMFHTKFVTVLKAQPTITDVTASDIELKSKKEQPLYYILEPEIGKMIHFFESQILVLLFEAVFLEVDLARLAARMISMNQSASNAQKILAEQTKKMLSLRKQMVNMSIMETYAGRIMK